MEHPPRKKVSSQDVADRAGVSRTTVSFVLNDRPNASIPAATRERVLAAAAELGYVPSPEARALRMGRSAIVLCLLPDWPITGPLGILLKQISAELAKSGLTMLSHQRNEADDLITVLQATTPTAVVAMCDLTAEEAHYSQRRNVHLTSWMSNTPGYPDEARLKQSDVGRMQVDALADLGHMSIAYALPADLELAWFSDPRCSGARERAEDRGLTFQEFRMPADEVDGPLSSREMFTRGATGFCAYNDEVAFSIISTARDVGLQVPSDLAVVGVDDSVVSRISRPSISTVAFDLTGEAERLSTLVTGRERAADKVGEASVIRVIHRESTGPRP